ncbi:Ribosomal RNA small subunit methyltransferase E [Galdieria sulphuraria]|uniref:16S rRNA (uracil(1498)-N(3))-methyltransferase n=1 Tax=Galdieria sulphuraria TaxID=130081 RepID=M2XPM6_GALSU|nr:ribosomal RNA small subunit methyltransferase E [Galdieria sulphuraria]EME32167.1 ribosomal RNA small subunit methyltransferase E [Galdieria sulphuraria]GJD09591.1 Ribosomal RNA small subunit methyltransferase E [Galdieria sulphuraria]|eukprot:XP_005708687.1 ribosomal RNA small subunit methyltransferase E [Galdieria sulphuraria]
MLLWIPTGVTFYKIFQRNYLFSRWPRKPSKSALCRHCIVASLSRVFIGDSPEKATSNHFRNINSGIILYLEEEETQHLKARRVRENEALEVFDGSGYVGRAVFLGFSKDNQRSAKILIRSWTPVEAEEHVKLTIGVGVPKGKRGDWLVEKLTEVGVDSLIPVRYERTNYEPSVVDRGKQQRWRKVCIAACKQCCRNNLMLIESEQSFRDIMWKQQSTKHWDKVYVASTTAPFLSSVPQMKPTKVLGLIGPEGGLTPEEEQTVSDLGANFVKLNRYTLRVETAATVLASLIFSNVS